MNTGEGGMSRMQKKTTRKRRAAAVQENAATFGQSMSFAAKEAYKLLRTNLLFALPEPTEGRGYVIGVTSSLRGEGKSTTTLNLASTLAEQGARVLVVEADMRLPSLHKKVETIKTSPGLSNVLLTKEDPINYVQTVKVANQNEVEISFDVLPAGDIPPNPSELIGSNRMEHRIDTLAGMYNFVLLDLPPVTAVTDALVATSLVDGILMVVRNEYADSGSLKEAMRQLKLVEAKLLGFVYTCAGGSSGGYRNRYKYRYRYRYRYDNGYDKYE